VIPLRLAGHGSGGASLGSLCAISDRESAEARLDRYWGPDGRTRTVGTVFSQKWHVRVGGSVCKEATPPLDLL
jgi:hypothetical protein